jgi:hypothetical protein
MTAIGALFVVSASRLPASHDRDRRNGVELAGDRLGIVAVIVLERRSTASPPWLAVHLQSGQPRYRLFTLFRCACAEPLSIRLPSATAGGEPVKVVLDHTFGPRTPGRA